MPLASDVNNIRINGTGRLYVATVGSANIGMEVGEMDGLSDNISVADGEKIYSNRTGGGKLVIGQADGEVEGTVTCGLRETTAENLELAMNADPADVTSQLAGFLDAAEVALVEKEYIDVGKTGCFVTKLGLGTITGGPFDVGENVAQGAVTGKVGWVGVDYLELVNVAGTFLSGVAVVGATSLASAPVSTIETMVDLIVTDAAAATVRYALETDYRVDADYGFLMKMPGSTMGASAFVSADYAALSKKTIYPMSNKNAEKKLTFVTDANDKGPRIKYTYYRATPKISGDSTKIGSGEQVIPTVFTLLADTTKPIGKQFMSIELME